MEIHIDDDQKLSEIKAHFSEKFPFLKLEFFRHAHNEGDGSPKSDMITEDAKLGDIRNKHNEGDVVIKGDSHVSEVENEFEKKYGVYIQVFRQSGDIWLETSATDDWTLNEQNNTAREMAE